MNTIYKHDLRRLVNSAILDAGLSIKDFPDLAVKLVQSTAIRLDREVEARSDGSIEFTVMGTSLNAYRASGRHLNPFAMAGIVLTACTVAKADFPSIAALMLALVGACTSYMTPAQAAFFLATAEIDRTNAIPTAALIASKMRNFLGDPDFTVQGTLDVANSLRLLGVDVSISDLPGRTIHHQETVVFIPGM